MALVKLSSAAQRIGQRRGHKRRRGQKGRQWLRKMTLGLGRRWTVCRAGAEQSLLPPAPLAPSAVRPRPCLALLRPDGSNWKRLWPPGQLPAAAQRLPPGSCAQLRLFRPGGDLQRHEHLNGDTCCSCLLKGRHFATFFSRCLCKTPSISRRVTWNGKPWLQG